MHLRLSDSSRYLLLFLCLCLSTYSVAESKRRKSYTGLFGSFKKDRYADNENEQFALGVDLMLSTLIPVTDIVKQTETAGGAGESLNYSTFFDVEFELFYNLWYKWQVFVGVGHFSYDTRKERSSRTGSDFTNPSEVLNPKFVEFEMRVIPVMAGVRYRLTRTEVVPYVGLGAGMAFVRRKGSYDFTATLSDEESTSVMVGELLTGFEFFFAPGLGIKMELAAYYMKLPERRYDAAPNPANNPHIIYQANPWSVRYAAGLFYIF